ncbi:O-antigen ligase family protein [Nocardioides sp.]|uniref:O-antigen ligase family protein n=1 Tax=Nocardioides sp. TaxID=35761 RepID=UPI003569E849
MGVRLFWLAAAGAAGAAVGGAAAGAHPLIATTGLLVAGGVAAMLVLVRPALSVWVGVLVPAIELVLPSSTWHLAGFVLLLVGAVAAWPAASGLARRWATLFAVTAVWITFAGLVISPRGIGTTQLVIGIDYALLLAMVTALVTVKFDFIRLALAGWGVAASWLAITTPDLIADRSQTVIGENANGLGSLCALGLVAAASALAASRNRLLHWGWAVGVVCASGIVATGSRGALVAAVAGAGAVLLQPHLRRGGMRSVVIVGSSLLITYAAMDAGLRWFTAYVGRSSASFENVMGREEALRFAILTGWNNPLAGVGLGRLSVVPYYNGDQGLGLRAHNTFAGIFAESGVVALLLVLVVIGRALTRARLDPGGLLGLVVAFVVLGFTLEWWGTARVGVLAMFVMAAAGTSRRQIEQPEHAATEPSPTPAGG